MWSGITIVGIIILVGIVALVEIMWIINHFPTMPDIKSDDDHSGEDLQDY